MFLRYQQYLNPHYFKGNMRKQKKLVDSTVANFKNEVTQLINKRSDWQENQFKTSNEMLYDLLAQIYEL